MGNYTERLAPSRTVARSKGIEVGPFQTVPNPVDRQPDPNIVNVLADRNHSVCLYREAFGDLTMWHISVRRHDHKPIRDHWAVLQQVKDQVLGPEFEAVEIYPARSRLIDIEHTYHLWSPAQTCQACGGVGDVAMDQRSCRGCSSCCGLGTQPIHFEFGLRTPGGPVTDSRACVVVGKDEG